ncbi:cyclin-D4-1-like [Phalaenopsis equestris]|uniref:cyclin-D4-1-like n=1 Tax=Phalaenopsis equestris TaxID=78828 RepID=UPI0009E30E8A|nr:cyclin-D4-1-like [Phalaenopsis equestris]
MGIKSDCSSSILLCAEEDSSILSFDEEEEAEKHWSDCSVQQKSCDLYGRFFNDFPLLSDECLGLLIKREVEHLPREDYAQRLMSGCMNFSIRRDAIDWILKLHDYHNFGPLSAYLAVNYLDRFLSSYEPPQGKDWMAQLLSVGCLSLACKMEEIEAPLLLDLQVSETKFVFEAKTIQRMELLVLSTLKWRMQAVTPFSFIDYFLHKLNGDNSPSKTLVTRAVELILCTLRGIDFLAFRPSEIAVGVTLSVMGEAQPLNAFETISCCNMMDEERVLRCHKIIQEEIINCCEDPMSGIPLVHSLPLSPIGVLDAASLSYKSDELTSGSQSSWCLSSPAGKRRRLSRSSSSIRGTETL